MDDKVLLVDDDQNLLQAAKRHLRKRFVVFTALGGMEGLKLIKQEGPFSVIVSDLRMPGMDGIQFLQRVREAAPDTVRMMLTGNADLQSAVTAVNDGQVFQFLTKPCHQETLAKAISLGIKQYRLVTAERELLEKTLRGSILILTDMLSILNPEALGRSSRIKRLVNELAKHLSPRDRWAVETAAILSQIGFIILPPETLNKMYRGEPLSGEEKQLFDMHPSTAADLLRKIPRLEKIAEIVAYQEKCFDGSGVPRDDKKGRDIPLGARILKAVLDYDVLEGSGIAKRDAFAKMEERSNLYDPDVLASLKSIIEFEPPKNAWTLNLDQLEEGMILAEDLRSSKGRLLVSKGHELSPILINRLNNVKKSMGIKEPVKVYAPQDR